MESNSSTPSAESAKVAAAAAAAAVPANDETTNDHANQNNDPFIPRSSSSSSSSSSSTHETGNSATQPTTVVSLWREGKEEEKEDEDARLRLQRTLGTSSSLSPPPKDSHNNNNHSTNPNTTICHSNKVLYARDDSELLSRASISQKSSSSSSSSVSESLFSSSSTSTHQNNNRGRAHTVPGVSDSYDKDSNIDNDVDMDHKDTRAEEKPQQEVQQNVKQEQNEEQEDVEQEDDEDEEMKVARALALAIASNPRLHPDEIRELVGLPKVQVQQTQPQHPPPLPTANNSNSLRFSSMFSELESAFKSGVEKASATLAQASASNSFTAASTTLNATTNTGSSNTTATAATPTTPTTTTASALNSTITTATTTMAAATAAAASASLRMGESLRSVGDTLSTTMALSKTSAAATAAAAVPLSVENNINSLPTGLEAPSTDTDPASAVLPMTHSTFTTKTTVSEAPPALPPAPAPAPAPTIPVSSSHSIHQPSPSPPRQRTSSSSSTSTSTMRLSSIVRSPGKAAAATAALSPSKSHKVSSSSSSSSAANTTRIQLSTLAWKRRGGMGKYSLSAAWELRRMELVGTKLLYYRNENEVLENPNHTDSLLSITSSRSSDQTSLGDHHNDQALEGVVVNRRLNWFEQAAASLTAASSSAAAAAAAATASDITHPRGSLDLVKEKALVHASYGESGAPSPFSISIKVKNETKWKLCFSSHNTMMVWLAAMTDIIVQSSVDTFNASLLAAADPHHHSISAHLLESAASASASASVAFFAATAPPPPPLPSQQQPQPQPQPSGSPPNRLWMMEQYVIESGDKSNDRGVDNVKRDMNFMEGGHSSNNTISATSARTGLEETLPSITPHGLKSGTTTTSDLDHSHARWKAREESTTTWIIPERNLIHLGVFLNLALFSARSSSTSMESFWYLVVVSNFALLFAMVQEPDWKSVLEFVFDTQTTTPVVTQSSSENIHFVSTRKIESHANDSATLAVETVSKSEDFIPTAGSSTVMLASPSDTAVNRLNQPFAGWCKVSPELMFVRSHGYLETKVKIPSPGQLYECVQVDIFESPHRYPDIGTRVKLPPVEFADDNDDDTAAGNVNPNQKKTWRMPDIFIVSIALPTDPPKVGRTSSDGGGYTITVYFRMKTETRAILRRVTADGYDACAKAAQPSDPQKSMINAVRLMEEWCRRAPTDPKFLARFKIVPNAHNLDEIGMPNWISKYNGKPFLVKRAGQTGFLYNHPEISCMEFDVSLHPFPYIAKQAICFMKESYFKRILVSFGFCIEGRSDDELPECLIGAMQLCYPDPAIAIQGSDFFSGTAPISFM